MMRHKLGEAFERVLASGQLILCEVGAFQRELALLRRKDCVAAGIGLYALAIALKAQWLHLGNEVMYHTFVANWLAVSLAGWCEPPSLSTQCAPRVRAGIATRYCPKNTFTSRPRQFAARWVANGVLRMHLRHLDEKNQRLQAFAAECRARMMGNAGLRSP
jgi:hypothetical protein